MTVRVHICTTRQGLYTVLCTAALLCPASGEQAHVQLKGRRCEQLLEQLVQSSPQLLIAYADVPEREVVWRGPSSGALDRITHAFGLQHWRAGEVHALAPTFRTFADTAHIRESTQEIRGRLKILPEYHVSVQIKPIATFPLDLLAQLAAATEPVALSQVPEPHTTALETAFREKSDERMIQIVESGRDAVQLELRPRAIVGLYSARTGRLIGTTRSVAQWVKGYQSDPLDVETVRHASSYGGDCEVNQGDHQWINWPVTIAPGESVRRLRQVAEIIANSSPERTQVVSVDPRIPDVRVFVSPGTYPASDMLSALCFAVPEAGARVVDERLHIFPTWIRKYASRDLALRAYGREYNSTHHFSRAWGIITTVWEAAPDALPADFAFDQTHFLSLREFEWSQLSAKQKDLVLDLFFGGGPRPDEETLGGIVAVTIPGAALCLQDDGRRSCRHIYPFDKLSWRPSISLEQSILADVRGPRAP